MAKDLVDVDEFTSPVHVPEGLDARDDAAGDVERIAQALANRTRHMKNITDVFGTDAAFRGQDNHFTAGNSFDHGLLGAGTDPDEPVIFSNVEPSVMGSAWRVVGAYKYAGGRYAQILVGTNSADTAGALLICTNAFFTKATQLWAQYDSAHDSIAVIWHRGKVRISYKPAGSAPWAPWPTDTHAVIGKGAAGGSAFEGYIGGDFKSSTWLIAALGVISNAEFNYNLRTVPIIPIDLSEAYANAALTDQTHGYALFWETSRASLGIRLRLARGTQFSKIEVIVLQGGAQPITLDLWRREYSGGWSVGTSPARVKLATATTPGSPGTYALVLDRAGQADWGVMNGLDEWYLILTHNTGQTTDEVLGAYLRDVIEPGPRNW